MAILAMDQYAHLIAGRLRGATLVASRDEIEGARSRGGRGKGARKIPVLAPYRWLREADPLPHSWDVTSDSIAAWVAGELGARRLILVKPAGAAGELVDPFFQHALPPGIDHVIVTADQLERLDAALCRLA
jgi:dihydroneopterin aldolase